jgi:hypothetical protein
LLLFFSGCHFLFAGCFRPGSNGPDEAQQLASHGGDDFALVLACSLGRYVA